MDRLPTPDAFYKSESPGERIVGTYIYPYCLLSAPNWEDPYSATEVIERIDVGSNRILVTRNGGLFIRPPETLAYINDPGTEPGENLDAKLEFEEQAAILFNRVICELAFHGIISEPATPVHISAGKLIDDHALIVAAGGGREIYLERTLNPSMHLLQGTWRMHRVHDPQIVSNVTRLVCSSKLSQISENLPGLAAGAYSLFSQRQLPEALTDAWIVIEQIVDWLWTDYLSQLDDTNRQERLSDTRTYSAAVRIEILHTVGTLTSSLYSALNVARKHRNNLAHRAKISLDMAIETVSAMKDMIESFCKTSIATPLATSGVNW